MQIIQKLQFNVCVCVCLCVGVFLIYTLLHLKGNGVRAVIEERQIQLAKIHALKLFSISSVSFTSRDRGMGERNILFSSHLSGQTSI